MVRPSKFEELIRRRPNQSGVRPRDFVRPRESSHGERLWRAPTPSKLRSERLIERASCVRLFVLVVLCVTSFTELAQAQQNVSGPSAGSGGMIEIRARSEVRISTRTNGLTFNMTGTLIDDRGTGLGDEDVAVTLVSSGDVSAWRRTVTTDAEGSFRLAGNVANDGEYVLRAVWDGGQWIDGAIETQAVELKRKSVGWHVESPLIVPTQGEQALRENDEVVILGTLEASSEDISLTGSCLDADIFETSFLIPLENDSRVVADPPIAGSSSDTPVESSNSADRDVGNTFAITRTASAFESPCEVVASVDQTRTHDAESRTIEIIPVTQPLQFDLNAVSRPWSREQSYDLSMRGVRAGPLEPPAAFRLKTSTSERRSDAYLKGRWDLASEGTLFSGISAPGSDAMDVRVQHLDAGGNPLWWSEEVQVSARGSGDTLRRGLILFMAVLAAIALIYALSIAARKYLIRTSARAVRRRRTVNREQEPVSVEPAVVPGTHVLIQDARSGWSVRDAWVHREQGTHHWSSSQQRPGVVDLPETARGMTLVAGAPGYFESTFRYPGGELEVSLRPAREFVHERAASLFSSCGAPEFAKEAGWGKQPPRQVLFTVIRRRYPLWTDALNLADSTRPVESVRSAVAAANAETRLSIPNVLALGALLLETAMLAPSTPEDVPELLDALVGIFEREGL